MTAVDITKILGALKTFGSYDFAGAVAAFESEDTQAKVVGGLIGLDDALKIAGLFFPPAAAVASDLGMAIAFEPVAAQAFAWLAAQPGPDMRGKVMVMGHAMDATGIFQAAAPPAPAIAPTHRGPSPAPVRDPKPATTESSTSMTTSNLVTEAEKGAVDLGAGITNFFENIGTQLGTVAKTVKAGKTTTTTGAALPSVTTGGTNVLSQIEGAAGAIGTLVTDAKGGNIGGAVGDAVGLATTGMAILSKFGISVPGLSTFTSLLTEVEAFV